MKDTVTRVDPLAFAHHREPRSKSVPARTELLRQLERVVLAMEEPSLNRSRMLVARRLNFSSWDGLHRAIFGSTDADLRILRESIDRRLARPEY